MSISRTEKEVPPQGTGQTLMAQPGLQSISEGKGTAQSPGQAGGWSARDAAVPGLHQAGSAHVSAFLLALATC